MNKETPVVAACLAIVTSTPGVSINGIMAQIGHSHGGSKKYTDNQVFSGVQYLKTSGEVQFDDRVKKNQGLYVKGVDIKKMHPEPLKVSYRAQPQPRAPKLEPRYMMQRKDGDVFTTIVENDDETIVRSVFESMSKDKTNKGVEFEFVDRRPEPEAPTDAETEQPANTEQPEGANA